MKEDLKQIITIDFFEQYYKLTSEKEKLDYCIQFIIRKLSEQSISAMVGAGFSKNANKYYPDWPTLLLDAYKEMYPKRTKKKDNEDDNSYNNRIISIIKQKGVLNIAESYVKFKGKHENLDLYIEKQFTKINSRKVKKETHKNFLSLNWCDVITTNWDSLLDDLRNEYGYYLVKEAKELKNNNKKRIIKIHGSLRIDDEKDSNKLKYGFDGCYDHQYIITKKDFKGYKTNHKAFSDFMNVKILENSLCLIGFSGNDYNFRYWVKELKRTMTKGGEKKYPNPIFLFYTGQSSISAETTKFCNDNYIIPIDIFGLYNNYVKEKTQPTGAPIADSTVKISEVFRKIFEYLKKETDIRLNNENYNYQKDNSYELLHSFAFSNEKTNIKSFINDYNKTILFNYSNVVLGDSCITRIQSYFANLKNYTQKQYIFLYKWCLNNYYSLSNLFEEEYIEKIIKQYKSKKIYKTKAADFTELILKYYRENRHGNYFDKACELFKTKKTENIINYERGLFYRDTLDYKKLEELLNKWTPEKSTHPDGLFIFRKINLMLSLDNYRLFNDSFKNDISNLFKRALKNCKELQLKYFILLSFNYYLFSINKNNSFPIQEELNTINKRDVITPQKYLNNFITKNNSKIIKPNYKTRYIINYPLFTNKAENFEYINLLRFFNYFEYTGLPMWSVVNEAELISFVPFVKEYKHLLAKFFVHGIPYFGSSAEEDFLQTFIPLVLRNFDKRTNKSIFSECFLILKYKNNQNQNIKPFIFLLAEISKRVNKTTAQKFYDYFLKGIFSSKKTPNQIINGIRHGRIWGIKNPFLQCIDEVDDEKTFLNLLKWIMQKYIKEEKEQLKAPHKLSSDFLSYYKRMVIQRPDMENPLRQLFKEKDILSLLSEDLKLTKQLSLYAYNFIGEDIKSELLTYYEKAYSIQTDPFFITIFKSPKIKERVLSSIEKNNILVVDSRNYPIENCIIALKQVKLLNTEDKKRVIRIYSDNYKKIKDNHGFMYNQDNFLKEFYIVLETILTKKEKTSVPYFKTKYVSIKNEFLESIKDFYTFSWLYSQSTQDFKLNFINALTYFSCLKEGAKYLHVFNAALTKILVQDSSDFEAVIGLFEKKYTTYENGLFINEETTKILLQIMNKFKIAIPDCYDDLFIKKEMKLIANKMAEEKIKDDIIYFWINIEIN